MSKHSPARSISAVCFFLVLLLLSGCDNNDDSGTVGGSSGEPITENATPLPTTSSLSSALTTAIYDEYNARDTYQAVLDKFGQVRPFSNIVKAEEQHIQALVPLFNTYGLAVPAAPGGGLAAPESVAAACGIGVQAEIANGQLYDDLMAGVSDYPDVQAVFRQLQAATMEKHLPAFQRCAD